MHMAVGDIMLLRWSGEQAFGVCSVCVCVCSQMLYDINPPTDVGQMVWYGR